MNEPSFTPDQMAALDRLLATADEAGWGSPGIRAAIASAYVAGLKAGDAPHRPLMHRAMVELQRLRHALKTIADEGDERSAARARAALDADVPAPWGP